MEYVRCSGAFPGIFRAVLECFRSDLQQNVFFETVNFARVRRGEGADSAEFHNIVDSGPQKVF